MDIQRILTAENTLAALKKLQDVDKDANFEEIWRELKSYQMRVYERLTPLEEVELDRERQRFLSLSEDDQIPEEALTS